MNARSALTSQQAPLRPDAASRFFYVDEAGDAVLFKRRGRVLVGSEGCSRFFMLGKLDVPDPEALAAALTGLRGDLMADPTLRGVPSMRPERRRTAELFHARDDVPEVRREVFKCLLSFPVQFHAVVRDKLAVVEEVRARQVEHADRLYTHDELYDHCVASLLDGRLHKQRAYRIVFATRGSKPRTDALERGVIAAKQSFLRRQGIESVAPVEVVASNPRRVVCLQAVDYFLWALQRAFERHEHRWLDVIWPKVSGVCDRDDRRDGPSGRWYTSGHPRTEGFRGSDRAPRA